MSRALLAEEIKRLLPGEENKRIRQAILLAYGGAAGVARGVRNEIDQENRLRNGVLVVGSLDITSTTSATLEDWAWVVNFAVQQSGEQTLTILPPDEDFTRVDFFHGDDQGVIHYTPGDLDGDGNSVFPDIPDNHIILRKVLRNPDGSNEEGQPIEPESLLTFIEDFIIPMTQDNRLVRSGLRRNGDRLVSETRMAGLPAINLDEYVTLDQIPNNPQYGIISGGQIQWAREGLKYNASPVLYALNGPKSVGSRQVTLDDAHPSLDRFDVIGWDIDEEIFFITGTPAENPVIPSIDFATQVFGTAILVRAGLSTPETELSEEIIYAENTEWAVSSTGTGTLAAGSTNNPIAGSVSVEVTNIRNGFTVRFTNDTDINLDDFETIGFLMRLKDTLFAGYSLTAIWLNNSGSAISNSVFLSPERENTAVQFLAMSLSDWTFSNKIARAFQITFLRTRGGQVYPGFWLDNVRLEGGIQQPQPPTADFPEAPNDGKWYARRNLTWQSFLPFPEAPNDGKFYARRNEDWEEVETGGIEEAPEDGFFYTRKNKEWIKINPELSTSNEIKFDKPMIYGTNVLPITNTNLTDNNTDAKNFVQTIFHQASDLNVPTSWKKDIGSAEYDSNKIAIIYVEYYSNSYKRYIVTYDE